MAIYHLSVQTIGRRAGRSSVAAAAYRAGEALRDERTGMLHDYSHRRHIEKWTQAPRDAPEWVHDRAELWNRVEAAEKRCNARVAREVNIAIPKELDRDEERELVREYVQEAFVARGMVADVAIHRDHTDNPHAHILLTTREIGPEGFGGKVREWDRREALVEWREGWADHANRALDRAGRQERIDERSLAAQGIDRLPTVHEGKAVREMEARGVDTDRHWHNIEVAEHRSLGWHLLDCRDDREDIEREAERERVPARAGERGR